MNIYQTLSQKLDLKKSRFLVTTAIVCMCTAATTIINAVDFSGEWKLNEQKSDLGQFGRGAARKIKVNGVQANEISFERTSTNQAGEEVVRKEKLTFDGKETESIGFGNSKRKSTAKWSDDGQAMMVNATIMLDRNGEITEIKQKETWKLADNGQTLSIESNSVSSFGENNMKLVYDKVK
jgi:hypothetical protein